MRTTIRLPEGEICLCLSRDEFRVLAQQLGQLKIETESYQTHLAREEVQKGIQAIIKYRVPYINDKEG